MILRKLPDFTKALSSTLLSLAFTFVLASNVKAETGVTDSTILLGQTATNKGAFQALVAAINVGVNAHFNEVNAKGGVNGRKIKLIQLDDEYNVEKATANVNKLINEEGVFALFGVFGTPITAAAIPIAEKEKVPLIAPFTGADYLRKDFKRYYFSPNASYAREIEKMIEHMATLNIKQIGVVYVNNPFGKDGLTGAQDAFAKFKITAAAIAPMEVNSSNVAEAVATMIKANPSVIIMSSAGKPTLDFIQAFRKAGGRSQFYLLSVTDVTALAKALGTGSKGITLTQTMPYPWSASSSIARDYRAAMKAAGKTEFDYTTMQGYVSAKLMVEGLRATGKNLTRERFVEVMERMNKLDLGGFELSFSPKSHHGSSYVDITMISGDGRFLR
jgi:branched-chain amino acid transport system substrate-binding protein